MPNKAPSSTQKYLSILSLREGIVIMHDGGLRMILKVGSVNFALKSEDEQNGLIGQYQGFLNSLKFPLQIVMQSRRLDLFSYLRFLKEATDKQTDDLIRLQTEDYTNYIERLISKANIMDKQFYVVIPYFPTGVERPTFIDKIFGSKKTNDVHYSSDEFKRYREQLEERTSVVVSGLGGIGLKVEMLTTQQVVELLYSIYNPEEAMNERLTGVQDLNAPIISGQILNKKEDAIVAEAINQPPQDIKAEITQTPDTQVSGQADVAMPIAQLPPTMQTGTEPAATFATPQAILDVTVVGTPQPGTNNPPLPTVAPPAQGEETPVNQALTQAVAETDIIAPAPSSAPSQPEEQQNA